MSDERIPTMVQMSDGIIPTMPQDERLATIPQQMMPEEERLATIPQQMMPQDERLATIPQQMMSQDGRFATIPQQGVAGASSGGLILMSDVRFTGDRGGIFVIHASDVISSDSGESQIYGCENISGGEKYVARVLLSVTPGSDANKKMTRDKVIRFLDAMSPNPDAHILPLVDHGTINAATGEHYVEVYPFCPEGDLGRKKGNISYQELKDEIIPAVNQALHFFHEAGLVHRDIKPDNLYKYNGHVVVGDFGITCDLREDGFATDRYKTGTLGYYAPELMSQAAIKASDYYSFGQTIWTLYSGEMMYGNILRRFKEYGIEEQRNQVNFAMLSNTYYGLDEISKNDSFLEILIRGLLQYDPSTRFDYEKVKRWISGDKSLTHEIADYNAEKTFSRAYKLFGKDCWDNDDVVSMLCKYWDEALQVLYDGELKDFYASQIFENARFIDGIMKKYSAGSDENSTKQLNNVGLARVILYLSKNKILCWCGHVYRSPRDISNAIGKCMATNNYDNDYFGLIASELIGEWYGAMPNMNKGVLEEIRALTNMYKVDEHGKNIAYFWLRYLFAEENELVLYDCTNLQDLIKNLVSYRTLIYGDGNFTPIVDDYNFLGLLCAWGYSDAVKIFHREFDKGYLVRYELLFDFMEQQTEDKTVMLLLTHFYCECGPKAYLTWWKNNLPLYKFIGSGCNALKKDIEGIWTNPNNSISDQRKTFGMLERLLYLFMDYMESDIFMGTIGIQGLKNEYIYSDAVEGQWFYEFLGQKAPLGFKFYMGL